MTEKIPALISPAVFADLIEQAEMAIKQVTDLRGLRYFPRPNTAVLQREILSAMQKSVDAGPYVERYEIQIKDFEP